MKKIYITLFGLGTILLGVQIYREVSESQIPIVYVNYSYYDFALKRCNSNSNSNSNSESTQNWSIHGLWPQYNESSWPEFCNPQRKYNPSILQTLVPIMNEVWYSCEDSSTNNKFWNHEWTKHGTCTNNMTQLEYFNQTLELYNQFIHSEQLQQYCSDSQDQEQCLLPVDLTMSFMPPSISISSSTSFFHIWIWNPLKKIGLI